ncbi:IS3 family transposase [Brevibacterium sp. FAM 25378]|uniref:IS3 family transposase n=1 Tax=unclassified Brevibacterium TaxID=2614124 RepID=UPI001F100DC8|nr:IS3 family transposase [Brevibacterium sp. S22]
MFSEEGNFPIGKMCGWSEVSRSGYYGWRNRPLSATAHWRADMAHLVEEIFTAHAGTYGYRRIAAELHRQGHPIDEQTVRSIMRELGLVACQVKAGGPRTTIPAADADDLPDLLRRDFTSDRLGAKLVGDITYIPTWQGWLYLATVLDCHSKMVVGYAMADNMRTTLVTDALEMAAKNGFTTPGETIFHSDRGTQYMSNEFALFCEAYGIVRSVGRTGICYDNAWAESFNSTLKVERVHRVVYPTRRRAIADIASWIELYYNRQRIHSALGYRTPAEIVESWIYTRAA